MPKKTILLVDDDLDTLISLRDALEFIGYTVYTAMNGIDAFANARHLNPDLVMLDVMMPGENGFDVCTRLKNTTETKDIPVIMLTAKSLMGDMEHALDNGAVSYIVKPFDMDDLQHKIEIYIRK
jgi:DNA-binding response OmpR family regulator